MFKTTDRISTLHLGQCGYPVGDFLTTGDWMKDPLWLIIASMKSGGTDGMCRTQRSSSCRPLVALPMPHNPCFCLMSTQWSFYMKWSPQKTHGLLRQRCQRFWEGERVWGMLISSLHVILHRFISQCHQTRAGDKAGSAGKKHNISCWQVESLFPRKTQRPSGQTEDNEHTWWESRTQKAMAFMYPYHSRTEDTVGEKTPHMVKSKAKPQSNLNEAG